MNKKSYIAFATILLLLCTACKGKEPEQIPEEPVREIPIIEQLPEEPESEPEVIPEPEISEKEKARNELIEKHGSSIVEAWEMLSEHEFFDFADKELVIEEWYDHEGRKRYECYKVMEDGSLESAHFGGEYYIMGAYLSDEALFDMVEYHNEFCAKN